MSAPLTKRYRVTVLESSTYAITIEAESPSSAEAKVRSLWDRGETKQFVTKDVSLDHLEVELFWAQ